MVEWHCYGCDAEFAEPACVREGLIGWECCPECGSVDVVDLDRDFGEDV